MTIIISKEGKNAHKLETTDFPDEDYLQKYITENPDIIPLYDIKDDIKFLIIAREFGTNSGNIDALGIDQDGQVYIVETKLYKNPDKRKVIAQVLDYGASLWKNFGDDNEFFKKINSFTETSYHISFDQRLKEFFGIDDDELNNIYEKISSNISQGNLKFIVLMDRLHQELKDMITFVNENSKFDIYAVELEYYKHEDNEIMIPKLYGSEIRKTTRVVDRSGPRDEQFHFDRCDEHAKELYLELKKRALTLGDYIEIVPLKIYIKFKRNTNFMDVQFQKSNIVVYLNMKMGTLGDAELEKLWKTLEEKEIGRDVSKKNHNCNGDYEFTIYEFEDLDNIITLARKSYEKN